MGQYGPSSHGNCGIGSPLDNVESASCRPDCCGSGEEFERAAPDRFLQFYPPDATSVWRATWLAAAQPWAPVRVLAAFCAARLRPAGPFVRTAFAAAFRKLCLPRVRALLRACRESATSDAAE